MRPAKPLKAFEFETSVVYVNVVVKAGVMAVKFLTTNIQTKNTVMKYSKTRF